jgi:hypothetical protein
MSSVWRDCEVPMNACLMTLEVDMTSAWHVMNESHRLHQYCDSKCSWAIGYSLTAGDVTHFHNTLKPAYNGTLRDRNLVPFQEGFFQHGYLKFGSSGLQILDPVQGFLKNRFQYAQLPFDGFQCIKYSTEIPRKPSISSIRRPHMVPSLILWILSF